MSSPLRSEGTLLQVNEKTYWFKDDFQGSELSVDQAIALFETILERELNPFETKLLISRPFNGSTNITIVSILVGRPSQSNYLQSITREVVGYVVRRRENTARFNYGDVVGTDGFYGVDGTLMGKLTITRKDEPGLQTPLLDPIDFAGGALADIVKAGVKMMIRAGAEAAAGSFRAAMVRVELRLLARGARSEASTLRVLTEEELAMSWGGGTTKPLTENEVGKAIELLRNGEDIHVESLGQMRQIQGELGQLGVRSESSSSMIPMRKVASTVGEEEVAELPGSYKAGRGTYRVDPPHGPEKIPYSAHNEYTHINITLRNGKKLAILVTGSKSF